MSDETVQKPTADDELAVWNTDSKTDANSNSVSPGSDSRPGAAAFERSVVDNVPVVLEAFIGSAKLSVSELLALKQGSTVPLNASLNQPAELKLNGQVVALGEVVAVGDNFGICIKEIYS